jgi:hypothetical protein
MGIRSAQTYLEQLYRVRDKLLRNEIQSYSIGDRNFSLFNLQELNEIINQVENAVVSQTQIVADMGGQSPGSWGGWGGDPRWP